MLSRQLEQPMFERFQRANMAGISVNVVCLEDNLAIKAMFDRGPEQGRHDWADIGEMLAHTVTIDWEYLFWRLEQTLPDRAAELFARLQAIRSGL